MPELPEVETMVRDLVPRLEGRAIAAVDAAYPGEVIWPNFDDFQRRVSGQTILRVWRRGKFAVLDLVAGDSLIIHRGMSGSLLWRSPSDAMEKYVRILFRLDDGWELRLNDPRKFGKVFLMRSSGDERPLPWERMGPEPMSDAFTPLLLEERLRSRTAPIKSVLLNQHVVAGLGNIYVDEALHLARIHPEQRAHTLTRTQLRRLHAAIGEVLAAAVADRGTTFSIYTDLEGRSGQYQERLRVFHRAGFSCPRCGTTIIKFVVGGRGTHICPRCQKKK